MPEPCRQANTDADAGMRLGAGANLCYGRIHIHNLGLNIGQITDWAYQSSLNTPFLAGQVPEPSTLGLLLLFGAAFWLVRKRLRLSPKVGGAAASQGTAKARIDSPPPSG